MKTPWRPSLFPRQWDLMRACRPSNKWLVLASGPRYSSKTVACLNALVEHAWMTRNANVLLVTITQSVGTDSGVWTDLTETVIPQWLEGLGVEWVHQPYLENSTKKPCCKIPNRFGGVSKFQLDSLKDERKVEGRYKSRRYSAIFMNELSKFRYRKTFDTMKQILRMVHLKDEEHLFLADTNPADEGVNSWIWDLWYRFRTDEHLADQDKPLAEALNLLEFTIDDNLSVTPSKRASLFADFSHDEDLLQRYYYGKWVTASTDALFYKVFSEQRHVLGEIETPANTEPEMLVPEENCFELVTGLDPGVTNCAWASMEKAFRTRIVIGENDEQIEKQESVFKVLDELVVVGEDFDLPAYVEEIVARMDFWEKLMGKTGRVAWRHWSDRSAFDNKVPFSERYWHQHIFQCSNNRIALMAAARGPNSVRQRVDLFRKLLFEDRIWFSRTRCPNVIEMVKSIRRGNTVSQVIARDSKFKHIFDALTYAIASECYDELQSEVLNLLRPPKQESSVVHVALQN